MLGLRCGGTRKVFGRQVYAFSCRCWNGAPDASFYDILPFISKTRSRLHCCNRTGKFGLLYKRMTRPSVNINKIATPERAGGNIPDVVKAAIDIQRFGADGITVHPRPDERHIRRSDVCVA